MDFLSVYARQMKTQYNKRMRANNHITWNDLDIVNKKIHDELDYLMTWNNEFNNESINRNMKQTIRLTESELKGMINEAVKKALQPARTRRPMNENRNKTIRLTESELRGIIQQSVRKALNEGKKDNNKYYPIEGMSDVYDLYRIGGDEWADKIHDMGNGDWAKTNEIFKNYQNKGWERRRGNITNHDYEKPKDTHNYRDRYEEDAYETRKEGRANLADIIRDWDITVAEWDKLSPKQQHSMIRQYYDERSPW